MNRMHIRDVSVLLLVTGLWVMTGSSIAAERACVPSPARPCPAISATPLSKDGVKPLISPVPVVPVKTSAPLRAVLIWTPKTVLIPPFTGEGYRFQPKTVSVPAFTGEGYRGYRFEPKTVNVPTFTGDGYRFQPKTVNVPVFTGEGYRSQPLKAIGPASVERRIRKQ